MTQASAQDSRLDFSVGIGYLVSSSEARFLTHDLALDAWPTESWGVGAGYSRQHGTGGIEGLGSVFVTGYTLTLRYRRRLFGDRTMLHVAYSPMQWWTRQDVRGTRAGTANSPVLELFVDYALSSRFGVRPGVRGKMGEGFAQYMTLAVLELW